MLIITNKQFDRLVERITEDARAPQPTDLGPDKIVFSPEDRELIFAEIAERRKQRR